MTKVMMYDDDAKTIEMLAEKMDLPEAEVISMLLGDADQILEDYLGEKNDD